MYKPKDRDTYVLFPELFPFGGRLDERNRIEGAFGNGKEHYGLSCVRYKGEESSEVWGRASLLAMNLKTALKRA